jgi:hypothetical protein
MELYLLAGFCSTAISPEGQICSKVSDTSWENLDNFSPHIILFIPLRSFFGTLRILSLNFKTASAAVSAYSHHLLLPCIR